MKIPQADDFVSNDKLYYVGAAWKAKSLGKEFIATARDAGIFLAVYNTTPWIQDYVPTLWLFLLLLVIAKLVFALVDYSLKWPADMIFNNRHQEREGRSPIYDKLNELEDKIDRL